MIPTQSPETTHGTTHTTGTNQKAQKQAKTAPLRPIAARRAAMLFVSFCAAFLSFLVGFEADAQTARIAGAVSSFGSSLTNAVGVAVDGAQNVYVITSAGQVYEETYSNSTTSYTENYLFTTGSGAGSGIAVNSAGTTLYVGTGASTHSVIQYTSSGSSFAPGATLPGSFTGATVPALDASGNVYVADASAGTVTKETPSVGTFNASVIGTGFITPQELAVDGSGNVFVNSGNAVEELVYSGGSYTKQLLTVGALTGLTGLSVDASGDLFLQTSSEVEEAVPSGNYVYTTTNYYAYSGTAIALDSSGDIYLAASTQSSGTKLTVGAGYLNFGSVGPGAPGYLTLAFTETAGSATLGTPTVLTQGLTGYDFTLSSGGTCVSGLKLNNGASCTVVVQFAPHASGSRMGAIHLVDNGGNTVGSSFLGGTGFAPLAVYQSVTLLNTISTGLSNGRGLTVDPAGNVWVANSTAAQILKFPAGSSTPTVFPTTNTCQPVGTALDGEGNLYYTCNGETNMYELVGGAGPSVAIPVGTRTDDHLSADAAGNLYPTSYQPNSNLFLKVAAGTHAVTTIATAPSTARFVGAYTDSAGNTYAPDYNNNILYELPAGSHTLTTLFSGAPLQAPHAISQDAAGNLYVTTTVPNTSGNGNSNLLRFSAGNYTAAPAQISVPGGDSLFITPDGDFYTIYSNTTLAVYTRTIFSLTYPSTAVGQVSASQTVTLENDGNAPLTIQTPTTGVNPSLSTNFIFDPSSTCPELSTTSPPAYLPANNTCTDVIQFAPRMAGTIGGSMVTTDNSADVNGSTQTIQMTGTAVVGAPTVTVANASGTLGQNVTLHATITGGGVVPTGAVTFVVGTGPTVTATCTSGTNSETCTATYPTSTGSAAGANTITASYAGDGNYASGTGTGTLTLAAAPTSSTVSSSSNPSTFGTGITLTGKVTSTYATPAGTITFYDGNGSIVLGTATLDSTSKGTLSVSNLTAGSHSITVAYGGSANLATSTSSAINQKVNQATGYSDAVTASPSTSSFGSTVTLTDTIATLAGIPPTGTVTFTSGTLTLGPVAVNSSGVATITVSTLPVGMDTITASYSGDNNYAVPATQPKVVETVTPATISSSLGTNNASPSFGTSVTLTDTLPTLGGVAPTGVVTFKNGTTVIGTAQVNSSGVAVLNTTALPTGTDSVTAVYAGDTNYNTSTSNAVAENVSKANIATDTLATNNASPSYGSSVTLTTTLSAVNGVYPTGTVTFLNGTTAIGTGTLNASGVATLITTSLPVGTDTITSQYQGDTNFNASTSNAITETVSKANVASDVLSNTPASSTYGTSVTLSDTLTGLNGTAPTGSVTFYNGSTSLGTVNLTSGAASLTLSNLPAGADVITAKYSGDATYNTANSNPVTETVAKATAPDALTYSPSSPTYGTSVTLTDTFTAVNGAFPTGTVTFYNGTTSIGTGSINTAGVATLTLSNLPVGANSITAGYGGDANFNTETTTPVTVTVGRATGYGNNLATSNPSPSYGSSVTFTDTIAAVNGVNATGTVTFLNGTTAIGTGTLTAGVATLSVGSLPAGSDSITAVYNGDTNFAGSTSNAVAENVSKANVSSDVLAASTTSPAFGANVTLTTTLGGVGTLYPTGTVTFLNGTTAIGMGTINASGVATLTLNTLPVGADSITSQYPGDTNFNSSTSNAVTVTVAKATVPTDVLTNTPSSTNFGASVTLTDTLGAVNGTLPTGTVTFYNGTTSIGTATIASGVATLTTTTLPGGSDVLSASYGGDGNFNTANSNKVTQTVAKVTATDALTSSSSTPAYGSSVTLTDTLTPVAGVAPTGTVTFYNGTTAIGTGTVNASGVATLTLTNLPAGADSITAQYPGDTNYNAHTTTPVTVTVAKAAGYSNALGTSNASPTFGSNVTLTDTIAAVNGTFPTGTVTFFNGTTAIGTGTLNAGGVATLSTSTLPVGADSITAVYGGDNTFAGSTSNAVVENVAKISVASDVLGSSNLSPAYGSSVTLTDTLGAVGGNYPTGTITFMNGATAIGTAPLSASGVATLTVSTLPIGADTITAAYGGDNNFSSATSNGVTENVGKATGYGDVLTSSAASSTFGSNVTFTDTLAAVNGTYPTGTVTFVSGSVTLGTGTINGSGVATLTTGALPAGTDTVTANYAGDTTFGAATSNALTQKVGPATSYGDTLASSNGTPSWGSSVTFTDTLAGINNTYATGTVSFYNGTTLLGTGTLNAAGVATLTVSNLPVGSFTVTANYGGDANFGAQVSNAVPENVSKASGFGDVLSANPDNTSFGNSVMLTDTLASVNGTYPSGIVTFSSGSVTLGTAPVNASGVATLTTSALPVGTDAVTATYGGNGLFATESSNAVNVTIAKTSVPGDVLTTSNASPSVGASVTLTDKLSALAGTYPTGTVTFFNGSTSLGNGTLSATGVATLTTSALPAGTDNVTAVYNGDSTFSTATSNAVTETVAKLTDSSTLTSSTSTPAFGANVSFTDSLTTVNGIVPTGTVTFYNGSVALGTGTLNASGVATLSTSALPVGSDSVTAVYAGDTNYNTVTSNALGETVSKANVSSDVLAASTTSPTFGQSVTLTDTLASSNGVLPTGTVTFNNGTTVLGTANVDGSGVATLSVSTLPGGKNTVTATYNGDGNFNVATSNGVTVTVGKIAATTNDTATGSGTYGATTVPVTISIPYSGPTAPTGSITLTDTHSNTVTVQASTCSAANNVLTCTASLNTANEPAGSNAVTVSQAGDANYDGSSGSGTISLSKAALSNNDSATGTGTYGTATTAITVKIPFTGAAAPTGAVTVTDTYGNSVTVPNTACTAAAGVLTCTANLPTATEPVGSNNLSVSQAGDSNYSGSTGSGTITMGKAAATTTDTATGNGTYGAATTPVTISIPYAGSASPTGAITLTDTHSNTITIQASSCSASNGVLTCTAGLSTANEPIGSNTVNVSQAGDNNYSGSTGSGTITITKAAGTNSDTATGTGIFGAATTSVKVSIPYVGATAPTGAITVADAHNESVTVQASACTAAGNVLSCTAALPTFNEPAGNNPVTVTQAADANYAASTGDGTVQLSRAAATATDTANGTGTYGAATTAVTVTIPFTGSTAPGGPVSVTDSLGNTVSVAGSSCKVSGSTLLCPLNLPTATEPVGTNNVTVSQAADANYDGSTGSGTVSIGKAPATSSDTATGSGTYGAATTSVVVRIPYVGAQAPSGAITITDSFGETVTIQTSACSANGGALTCTASLPTANQPVGTNPVTVKQDADANYSGSTGGGNVTINPAGSRGDDTATGTGTYGAPSTPVTVIIPFTGAAPTGQITLADTFGNVVTVAASACQTSGNSLVCSATLPTANETVGNNAVSVAQAADASHAASTGAGSITINKAPATSTDTVTGTGTYGSLTTPVTVTIPYAGPLAPGGLITVTDSIGETASVPASACTAANQVLTCTLNLPTVNEPLGTNQVTVSQASDVNYAGSTGTGTVTISMATVSPVGSTAGGVQNVSITQGTASTLLTATLTYTGAAAPTGAVTFTVANGAAVPATCTAGLSDLICTAQYPTATLQPNTYTITASEAADANYIAGSATGTLTVETGNVSPILDTISNVSNILITSGTASAPLSANISYNGPMPTGTLTFSLPNATPITATCTSGPSPLTCTATYPTASLGVGTYVITATESADATYAQGSATALLTVEANASVPAPPILNTGSNVSSVLIPFGTPSASFYATINFNGPVPTGAVTFSVSGSPDGTVQATCNVVGSALNCTAVYPTATLGIGSYRIEVDEAADANYPAGTAIGTLTVTEVSASNADTVTGSGSYGASATPITVTIPYVGAVTPSGAITVTDSYNNTVTIPASSCTAASSKLTCPANLPTANVPVGTDQATVSEAADAMYAASTGTGSITIGKAAATSTDSATGTGVYGTATTAVSVTIPYAGTVAPTGTVTVSDTFNNTVTIQASSCTAASGVLTCTGNLPTANEPLGSNAVTVTQAADANYSGSTGNGTVTINKAGATNGDTVTGSGTYGSATTAVTITIPYTGNAAPTGAITISDSHGNTVSVQAATCTAAAGVLTCNTNLPTANEPVGANTVTVTQAADANYSGSTGTGTVTINKAASTSSDSATGTSAYGAPTTTVTVTIPYSGAVAPSGAITVADGNNNSVTVPASSCTASAGVLTCTVTLATASDPVGANAITVSQAADSNYAGSTGSGNVTVGKAAATITDTATGTGTFGAATTPVTITIPYAGTKAPTGAVSVTDSFGNTATVPALSCTAANGVLTCQTNLATANEPLGSNPVAVTQVGDSNYNGSTGQGSVTINKAGATNGDTASGMGTYGAATTAITVTIPYTGTVAPTGAITVTDTLNNSVAIQASACTAANASLTCSGVLPTANEPVGANQVSIAQAPDADHSGSTGTGTVTINKALATTGDTATGTGTYGAATTAVTVSIPYAGVAAPTGAVTVTDSLNETATAQASACSAAKGVLTCTVNLPTVSEQVGPNAVTVAQAADANYSGSTGTGTVTINKAAGGSDAATGTGNYGAPTTALTVTVPYTGSAPTGAITIADTLGNTVTINASACTSANNTLACSATLPTANEPVGANQVSVTQAADANHGASTGSGTVTINKAPATSSDSVTGTGTYGAATTTVTVTIPYTGVAAPTGAITVSDGAGDTVTIPASNCTAAAGKLTCTASLPTANAQVGSTSLTVSQAGDANYSGSTGAGSVTLNKAGAGTDSAAGTGTYGAATTAVTISIPYTGAAPTGAITLADNYKNTLTVQASTCTAANGTLTCSVNLPTVSEPAGANQVTVAQAADANHAASTGTGTITLSKAAATSDDTVTGTSTYGTAKTEVTVTIPYAGSAAPTGAITIADSLGNTVTVQASSCTAAKGVLTCTASLPSANEPAGTNTITVSQAADANYSGSTGKGSTAVSKSTPTLPAPTVSPLNSATGTTVTLTETVPATETGTVTFTSNGTTLGTATIANGVATLTTSALPQGTDSITATANGDSNYLVATSPALADNVGGLAAKIALSSSQSTSTYGSAVTFTAAVTATSSTTVAGTVTFYDGATVLGTGTVSGGSASFSTASLALGTHTITATFNPASGSALGSVTSAPVSLAVRQVTGAVALTSSQNPAIVGQSITFTATVPFPSGGPSPTGTVTFTDGSTVLGTGQLNGSGVATYTVSTLSGGMHNVTASYAGDSTFGASTSPVVAQQVSDYTVSTTTPTMSADPGKSAAFNVTINPTSGVSFGNQVVLSVTGLPANFTAAFASGTVNPGKAGTSTTMTVQTFAQTLTAMEHQQHVKTFEAAAFWAFVFPLLGFRRIRRRLPKALLMLLVCVASFGVIAPLTGCGGGYFGPAPKTYTLTVTGTSGTLQRSTTVTLKVN